MSEIIMGIVVILVGVLIGSVATWLVLRNNPKIEAKLDDLAKKVEQLKK